MRLNDLLDGQGIAIEVHQGTSFTYAQLRGMVSERAQCWTKMHGVSGLTRQVVVIQEDSVLEQIISLFAASRLNMILSLNGDPQEVCARWVCSNGVLVPVVSDPRDYGDDVDVLFMTSGSTHTRRIVGHREMALLKCAAEMSNALSLSATSRVALPLELSFHYGFSLLSSTLISKGTLLLPSLLPREPLFLFGLNDWLTSCKPTVLAGVPQGWDVYTRLLSPNIWDGLETLISAGDLISSDTLSRIAACHTKAVLHIFYGSTEVLRTCHRRWEPTDSEGCIGHPLPSVHLHTVTGGVVQSGETIFEELWEGERCIRAPSDWMLSDTIQENAGVWYFLHRNADVIKVGGERISPIRIEKALCVNEAVDDCVVVEHNRKLLAILFVPEPKDDTTLILDLPLRLHPQTWIVLQQPFPLTKRQKRSRQWIASYALRDHTPAHRAPWRLVSH